MLMGRRDYRRYVYGDGGYGWETEGCGWEWQERAVSDTSGGEAFYCLDGPRCRHGERTLSQWISDSITAS